MPEREERRSRTRMLQAWRAAKDATDAWHAAKVRLAEAQLYDAHRLMVELTGAAHAAERIDFDELVEEWRLMRGEGQSVPKQQAPEHRCSAMGALIRRLASYIGL